MSAPFGVGELMGVGFRGMTVPKWLEEFSARFGLGAVILFDYDFQSKTYKNNIESAEQLTELCAALHELPGSPLILIDQEGGKVRRLKETLGFAPLPSAKEFAKLADDKKREVVLGSFAEMVGLGIDMDLAPVLDVDFNPLNPDIGKVERSFSADFATVEKCVDIQNAAAKAANLLLCLKHYPGLGGATTNSHLELTDVSASLNDQQLELFYRWGTEIYGEAVLLSHGVVKQWDSLPVSMSAKAISDLRAKLPNALFVSDDLQMQGLQVFFKTGAGALQAISAGMDLVLIGNNLLDEQKQMQSIAEELERGLEAGKLWDSARWSFERVQARKFLRPTNHQ